MYNHAPTDYVCPFCCLIQGIPNKISQLKQTDIVYQTDSVTAIMATRRWPNNQGHVLVIPNQYFENIYDLIDEKIAEIH